MAKLILVFYIIIIISVAVHELCHYAAAKILRLDIVSVCFGSRLLQIKIKKVRISPIMFTGYVEVTEESLMRLKKAGIIFFFSSGISGNMIFFLGGLLISGGLMRLWILLLNIVSIAVNSLPFIRRTDAFEAIRILEKWDEEN